MQLLGVGQLRNRVGRSIFLNLRTEVVSRSQKSPVNVHSDILVAHQLSSAPGTGTYLIYKLDGRRSEI